MRLTKLYGYLGDLFGTDHYLDVHTPAEAVRALCCTIDGFEDALLKDKEGFSVFIDSISLEKDGLTHLVGVSEAIKIVPVLHAAKDGAGKILTGILILVVAYYTFGAGAVAAGEALGAASASAASVLYGIGASMILGGIAQVMAPLPPMSAGSLGNKVDARGYAFSGPTNTTSQGARIPILYGRLRVGAIVVSSGIDTQAFYMQHGNPSEAGVRFGNGSDVPWSWVISPVWTS